MYHTRIAITLSFFLFLSACEKAAKPLQSIEVASKGLHSAALSEDSAHAVVGSIYHGGSMWRIEDGERLYNWNHDSDEATTITAADFSDDGRWAVTAHPHTMVLWNADSGQSVRYWTAPAEILDIELNAQASLALLGLEDQSAVIFDIRRGGIRRTFAHKNRVRSVDFDRSGSLAITGSEDYTASVWDTRSGQAITTIKHEDDVQLVRLSDDGQLALSVSKYDKALIWYARSAERVAEIPLKAEKLKRGLTFTSARFNRDNTRLLTGRPDRVVQLWALQTEITPHTITELKRWKVPKRDRWKPTDAYISDVAFSKTDEAYYAISSNGFIHKL